MDVLDFICVVPF